MSLNLPENDILMIKFIKILKECLQKVIYQILKDLYKCHPFIIDKTVENIYELCKKVTNGGELRKKIDKQNFPSDFFFSINNGKDSHPNLDIAHCIQLIMKVVSKKHIEESSDWKGLKIVLENILTIRNKISHEERQEETYINEFKFTIIDSLNKIPKYMSSIYEYLNLDAINVTKKYEHICQNTIKDMDLVWSSPITDTLKWLIELNNIDINKKYISLISSKLEEVYKDSYMSDNLRTEFLYYASPLLELEKSNCNKGRSINYEELLNSKHTAIVLVGDSGCGKSSLCNKIIQDWCSLDKIFVTLKDYDLLLVIDATITSKKSLSEYLKQILFQGLFDDESDEILYLYLSQLKILFIIDDYNEKSDDANCLIESLLNIFNDHKTKKIVLTTKPSYSNNVYEHLGRAKLSYNKVSVRGLKDYAELSRFKLAESSSSFVKSCEELPFETWHILSTPAICLLLIDLFKSNNNLNFETLTVYHLHIQALKLKKNSLISQFSNISEFENMLENILFQIFNQCYDRLKELKFISSRINKCINIKKLNDTLNTPGCLVSILNSIFKFSPVVGSSRNDVSNFEFWHITQFECYAAFNVANCLLSPQKNSLSFLQIFEKIELKENISFLFAIVDILKEKNKIKYYIEDIITILNEKFFSISNEYCIFWKILNETDQAGKICNFYKRKLTNHWQLNEETVVNAINILNFVDCNPNSIEISIEDNFSLSPFKKSWDKMPKQLNVIKDINLTLHVDRKNDPKDCEFIMEHLTLKGLNLTIFTGHIGTKGCKMLKPYRNLEKISCRISTLEVLNTFNEIISVSWKEIWLHFDEPFSTKDTSKKEMIPKLRCQKHQKICIEFIASEKLGAVICNLKELKPQETKFALVKLRIDKYPTERNIKDMKKPLNSLKEMVIETLVVLSKHDVSEKDLNNMKKELSPVVIDWQHIK